MKTQDLTRNSQKLCQSAQEILEITNLREILSEMGRVEIIGSLRWKAMYRLDIDLLVISEDINKDKALKVTKKYLDSGLFKKVSLTNYLEFPVHDMPLGFTWELIALHKDMEWKFDIWYLKPSESYTHLVSDSIKRFEPLLSKNPEKIDIILKIKEKYFDGVKYKDNITGFDIYTAVLERGISSIEEFETRSKL